MKLSLAPFGLLILVACSSGGEQAPSAPLSTTPPPVVLPPAGEPPPPPCSGKPGTFHDQPFDSGGETRHFWLHVPDSYRCENAAPIIVDFHGTGFGSDTDAVEESWATPDLVSASDDLGFIVVRPRSRMKAATTPGTFYYQWNINPGDVPKNKAFALELLADLKTKFHVDDARVYATGFSNGPGMATMFLGDEDTTFKGFGLMAGGLDGGPKRQKPFGADAPRIYTMTGFRDYMLMGKDALDTFLRAHEYPSAKRFDREADTGHEVYGWHFREAFAWMDAGKRPAPGTLAAPWIAESTNTTESLVELSTNASGSVIAVGAKGGLYTRSASGAWTSTTTLSAIAPISDVCFLPSGQGFAVGHGHAMTTDDGALWRDLTIPDLGTTQAFGYTYATTIACHGTRVTAGGLWAAATSEDGGKTWNIAHLEMGGAPEQPAFLTAIRPLGTSWIGVGYFYAGHSSDGVTFADATPDSTTQWWNDASLVTSTHGVIVGEAGRVDLTGDGGSSFVPVTTPTKEDLYAVELRGARGVAVGAHGAVIVTTDSGATWSDRSTGLDGFLGGVRFVDDTTVIVSGERGVALRLSL